MVKGQGASIVERFRDLADPRMERSKRRQLPDIVAVAMCAVLCGADSWVHGRAALEQATVHLVSAWASCPELVEACPERSRRDGAPSPGAGGNMLSLGQATC